MSYIGKTFQIPCAAGGLFASDNIDLMPPEAIIHPSRNLILNKNTRETRGGTAHVNGTAISGTPEIIGGFDFILRNGTQQLVLATDDGKIYKDYTNTIKTGLTIDKVMSFEWFGNKLFMCNSADIPQTWDGSAGSTSNLGVGGVTVPGAPSFNNLNRVTTATALAIGSTKPKVANGAFTFYLSNSSYSQDADAVGIALSGGNIPKAKYGAWRLEVGGDNTVDIVAATSNATGYDDAAAAVTGLPVLSSNHASMGTVTASKSDAVFVPGTTDLDAANTTVAYIDGGTSGNVEDGAHSYKITFSNIHGETVGGTTSAVFTVRAKAFDGQISLTSIPLGQTTVTSRKIYRTVTGDAGDYKLVATLSDNTTTTYTDNVADASLGASAPTATTAALRPADWTGSNQPAWFINHARGNSRRLVAGGVADNLNTLYFSTSGDAEDFNTGLQTIIIETKDGAGIVGGVSFVGRLLVFGRQQAFVIDDSDVTTPANWGYGTTSWHGGAAHHRVIVKTDTDIHVMAEDGEIYSVVTTEAYGDYKRGSLTQPAFMHNWIKDNVKLSEIAQFHGVYDPVTRAVYWFVVRNGQTTVDTALVFFIDRPPKDAWIVHDNQDSVSGYSARSSFLVRKGTGDYRVYTGGYSGFAWKLGETTTSDNGNGYYNGFKTPNMTFEQPDIRKNFKRGRLITIPEGNFDVNVKWWVDGEGQVSKTVSLASTGDVFGTGAFGTAVFGADEVIDTSFELGQNGKRIQLEVYNSTAGEKFKISQILLSWKPLGSTPD